VRVCEDGCELSVEERELIGELLSGSGLIEIREKERRERLVRTLEDERYEETIGGLEHSGCKIDCLEDTQ
jgi:hypothetical protein